MSKVSIWYEHHSTPNRLGIVPPFNVEIVEGDKFVREAELVKVDKSMREVHTRRVDKLMREVSHDAGHHVDNHHIPTHRRRRNVECCAIY